MADPASLGGPLDRSSSPRWTDAVGLHLTAILAAVPAPAPTLRGGHERFACLVPRHEVAGVERHCVRLVDEVLLELAFLERPASSLLPSLLRTADPAVIALAVIAGSSGDPGHRDAWWGPWSMGPGRELTTPERIATLLVVLEAAARCCRDAGTAVFPAPAPARPGGW
jgi:hypothetical protein